MLCEDNAGNMLAVEDWAIIRDLLVPSNFLLASVSDSKMLHSHHPVNLHCINSMSLPNLLLKSIVAGIIM